MPNKRHTPYADSQPSSAARVCKLRIQPVDVAEATELGREWSAQLVGVHHTAHVFSGANIHQKSKECRQCPSQGPAAPLSINQAQLCAHKADKAAVSMPSSVGIAPLILFVLACLSRGGSGQAVSKKAKKGCSPAGQVASICAHRKLRAFRSPIWVGILPVSDMPSIALRECRRWTARAYALRSCDAGGKDAPG